MANSNINILDVEKVEKAISKLEALNESINKYTKILTTETNKMSTYWKDNKYKEVKGRFDDAAIMLNKIKENSTSIKENMEKQINKGKQIMTVSIKGGK